MNMPDRKRTLSRVSAVAIAAMALAACSAGNTGSSAATSDTGAAARMQACKAVSEAEIAGLFDRWNAALQSGDPKNVVALYGDHSILLPTVSNKPRLTPAEKEDYFVHFMADDPVGSIDMRHIQIGCDDAVDAGLYTFTYRRTGKQVSARYTYTYRWDGSAWKISSHHSSAMPEKPGAAVH